MKTAEITLGPDTEASDGRIERCVRMLDRRLREAKDDLGELGESLSLKGDYGPGRGDPVVYQWEMNLARKVKLCRRIEDIQEALSKASAGAYGTCETCGHPIQIERLEALPSAGLCIECARAKEGSV